MSLARTILLRASRSAWLAKQFRSHEFTRRAVKSFLPGEELGAALDAAAALAAQDLGSVITNLGERVTTRGEAAAVREHYLRTRRHPGAVASHAALSEADASGTRGGP